MKPGIILSLIVVLISTAVYTGTKKNGVSSTSNRLQPSDLEYLGAFRLPDGVPGSEVKTWGWGGFAMTYYPAGDPGGPADGYPGSIFGTGHAWEYQVSEISIPAPVISASKNLNDLNTASTLQSFRDIFDVANREIPRVGLAYLPKQGAQTSDKLYFGVGEHFQNAGDLTHGWFELNLSNPQIKGRWYIDCPHYYYNTNDYLFDIPADWASANTPGKLLASGRFRDGGWSGQGPALVAIGPWSQGNPPPSGTSLQYTTLLRYTSTEDAESWNPATNHNMTDYHHSDEWSGAVWLTAGTKSAVVFVGTKGTGECWYGFGNGVVWPEEPPYPPVPAPPYDERGWWSTGFEGRFIFYDPDDLAAVAKGAMQSWEPQPYAGLNVDQYLYHIGSTRQWHHLGAACFDRENGLLYVFEPYVDDDKPIVHVWKVKGGGSGGGGGGGGDGCGLPPFGEFATPQDNSTVRSSIPVTGWALDDCEVESVKIYRMEGSTSVYIGDAVFVTGARPDIEAAYPGYPHNDRAGWGYMMLTNFLPNQGNGTFTIYAKATDREGNAVVLGTRTIICDNAHTVKPFGAIDTPVQGGTASGSSFINWGWVLTPQPNSIPTDGSTINVYVDGIDIGHPVYNNYRSDIAGLFPGYANSNGAVGYFYLDTTAYENGVHTIQWTAADNAGNTDGIGSRYFTIQNTGASSRTAELSDTCLVLSEKISQIPAVSPGTIGIRKGYKTENKLQQLHPDNKGMITIRIGELERIEIHLTPNTKHLTLKNASSGRYNGYMAVEAYLKPLPIGSTLDRERGVFYWQPGPGFVGEFTFIFIRRTADGTFDKQKIMIKIVPF
jgi:hypothetical protein